MKRKKTEIKGYKCKECGSTDITRIQKPSRNKFFAVCRRCNSEDLMPICDECGSDKLHHDPHHNETVCLECGLVLSFRPHYVGGRTYAKPAWL